MRGGDLPDFSTYCEAACKKLWGTPAKDTPKQMRWNGGDDYSYRTFDKRKHVWYDAATQRGGSTLELAAFARNEPAPTNGLRGEAFFRDWEWLHDNVLPDMPPPPKPNGGSFNIVATYDYSDEAGTMLFQVVRLDPKDFRQRKPDKSKPDGWVWSVKGVRVVPYRLPDLVEALAQDRLVFVAEGERDTDNLWRLGVPTTTNAGGVGKWKPELSQFLAGADVVILPDRDPQRTDKKTGALMFHPDGRPMLPGQDHAQDIAAALTGIASRVRVLELWQSWPQMPLKGDVSNWLAHGGTAEQLYALADGVPDWQPTTPVGTASPTDGSRKSKDVGQQQKTTQLVAASAEALKAMTFAPIKYVVPDILVEGLTLFAGKPKIGKSWLLLHAALAVARGGFTLGNLHCIEGDVLYCALEDNERRLQSRITKLIGISPSWPARLFYFCQLPRLAQGGLLAIREWIKSKPHPRLVIIDTLAMVRAPRKRDETAYDADYNAVVELRSLAHEFGIAIVLVHHLRKAESDDAFDTISGTLGLTGAPDSILVLKRDSNGTVVLHGRGRDLIEIEKAMTFNADACTWQIAGDPAALRRSQERKTVLDAIDEAAEPIGPIQIAAATGMKAASVRQLLAKLVKEGEIKKATYGKYHRSQKASAA